MLGGTGGTWFEDPRTNKELSSITIWWGSVVHKLQCFYVDGSKSSEHGGSHGRRDEFYLNPGESIVHVTMCSGNRIDSMQFQTTSGRLSKWFGGAGGSRTAHFGNGRPLMGFKGRCAEDIDALELVWSDSLEIKAPYIASGETFGGSGGSEFDMLQGNWDGGTNDPARNILKSVMVRSADRIDCIECHYQDLEGRDQRSGKKGGNGGAEGSFQLRDKEHIVRVQGRAGFKIHSLQFFTNMGRASRFYGGEGGEWPFTWTPPLLVGSSDSKHGMRLLCFQGRASSEIDMLAPVWVPEIPEKYELHIDPFDAGQLSKSNSIQVDSVFTTKQRFFNHSRATVEQTFSFATETTHSTKLELTRDSRNMIGGTVSLEVSVGGKAGIPLVAEGEFSHKAGISVTGEHEWGSSTTDGKEKTQTMKEEKTTKITIDPGAAVEAYAQGTRSSCKNVRWTGKVVAVYASGGTREMAVDGTISSAVVSGYTLRVSDTEPTAEEKAHFGKK